VPMITHVDMMLELVFSAQLMEQGYR
jgi:hypothetical protein